jgi:hypothetical protein
VGKCGALAEQSCQQRREGSDAIFSGSRRLSVFVIHVQALTLQIKKNTAAHELKPSDILLERFTAWKQIVKMLICTYERALRWD